MFEPKGELILTIVRDAVENDVIATMWSVAEEDAIDVVVSIGCNTIPDKLYGTVVVFHKSVQYDDIRKMDIFEKLSAVPYVLTAPVTETGYLMMKPLAPGA